MEVVSYLGILFLLILLLLPIIHAFFNSSPIYTQIRLEREAAIFFRHTEHELVEAFEYQIQKATNPFEQDQLMLMTESGIYRYSRKGNKAVREKLGQAQGGHLEMAHFVKELKFSVVNQRMLFISLTLEENGVQYTVDRLMGLKINKQHAVGTD